jgi:hypothetical protein
MIEGNIDVKTGKGRPKKLFMKQIIEDIGKNKYKELRVV